jgi:hypothetical protein
VLQAFFKIPVPTLSALIPVLEGVDQKVITAQLKALGSLSPEDIKKMVFFLNNVSTAGCQPTILSVTLRVCSSALMCHMVQSASQLWCLVLRMGPAEL